MNGKVVMGLLGAVVIAVIAIVIAVSGGGGQNNTSLSQVPSNQPDSGTSNPLNPAPSPTAPAGNPQDVYPDGKVPDWIDPERESHPDHGHEDDKADFSDDEHVLPPGAFGDWTPTAQAFGQAFADTTAGKEAWIEAMRPYASQKLIDDLSKGNVVPAKLNYVDVVLVKDNNSGRVDVAVSYGPQSITMTMLQTGSAWVVDSITGYHR